MNQIYTTPHPEQDRSALALTLEAVQIHGWRCVLLGERKKYPVTRTWQVTRDPSVISAHVDGGGNAGVITGPETGLAILDFDDDVAHREMVRALGPLAGWVQGRPGRVHCYVRWEPGLPAVLTWRGDRVGELIRGPRVVGESAMRQAVIPPSIHPDTLQTYRWLCDPRGSLPELPARWRSYFACLDIQPAPLRTAARPAANVLDRARRYLEAVGPAVQGQAGDLKTYKVAASLVRGFDLEPMTALDLMREWNRGCVPQWTDADLKAKVRSAMRSAKGPAGRLRDAGRAA